MNKTSKIISFILSIVMVLGVASAFTMCASAEDATAPTLNVKQISQDGNQVTVGVDLASGGFNALDFQFNTSEGVTCNEITVNSGVFSSSNPKNGQVAAISTNGYSTSGNLITATFTVPEDKEYSISGTSTNCSVSTKDASGNITDTSVTPSISGAATGKAVTTTKAAAKVSTKSTTKSTTKAATKATTNKAKTTNKATTTRRYNNNNNNYNSIRTTSLPATTSTTTEEITTEDVTEDIVVAEDIIPSYYTETTTSTTVAEEEDGNAIDTKVIAVIAGVAVLLVGGAVAAIVITNKKRRDEDAEFDD